jgi:hypothetical protein
MIYKTNMLIIALFLSNIIIPISVLSDVLAQNNTNTSTTITGRPETGIINQTSIPAVQTNVTVERTTQPVPQEALQPIGNLSSGSVTNLTKLENQTLIKPTGPATTTTINATQIPFNQTVTEVENQTQGQQQQQQQQQPNQTQGQQQQQQQSNNQSGKGPLEQMGEAISKTFGGK